MSGPSSVSGPFTMLGNDDAAACEGDACVIPVFGVPEDAAE